MSTQLDSEARRYIELLQCIDVVGISVLSVNARRRPDFKRPAKGSIRIESEPKMETLTADSLDVLVPTKVEGFSDTEESQFTCELHVRVSYSFRRRIPGLTDDETLVERFIQTNVLVNVWPYLREYVSWLTLNMGVGLVTLPLLKTLPESAKGDEA